MKRFNLQITAFLTVVLLSCNNEPAIKAPVAENIPHEIFDKRVDNYFWMRLSDEQKNADEPDEQTTKVIDYLTRDNEYTFITDLAGISEQSNPGNVINDI